MADDLTPGKGRRPGGAVPPAADPDAAGHAAAPHMPPLASDRYPDNLLDKRTVDDMDGGGQGASRWAERMPVLSEDQKAEAEASIDAGLERVARVHRILNLEGHHDMSLGHLSWRDPLGRGLWLKRARLGIEEVTADDFILIDFDGRVLVGCAVHRHLEWPIHTELMKRRPDIVAVGHTHPRYATLFSCTRETLRPLTNEGVWFEKPPPFFTETSDLVDTVALGRAHAQAMEGHDAIFLRNHGVSFVGRSIQELCLTGIFLEKACRAQIELAQSGLPYSWPEPEEVARKRANIYPPRARDNFFAYYDRLLTRIEQG